MISKLGDSSHFFTQRRVYAAQVSRSGSANKRRWTANTAHGNKLSTSQRFHSSPRATIIICPSIFHSLPFTLRSLRLGREQKKRTGVSSSSSFEKSNGNTRKAPAGRFQYVAAVCDRTWQIRARHVCLVARFHLEKHCYSAIVASGSYLESRVSNTRMKREAERRVFIIPSNEFEQRLSKFTSFGKFCRARMIEGYF